MAMRHKAVKATLDRGYASEWNDDHEANYTTYVCGEHIFLGVNLAAMWDFAQTAGGANPTITLVGAAGSEHVFVVLNTGGVTNQISSMRHELGGAVGNITSPDDLPVMDITVQIVAVHDAAGVANSVVEFGLQDDSDALFTQNQHFAIFRVYNGRIHSVTGNGAAETETDIAAYNAYGYYRIVFTSTSVVFFVDDMVNPAATHTLTLPDAALTMKASVRSRNNVDSTIRTDAIALTVLRAQ